MEIEYELREADILALMQYRLQQSRGKRNPVLVRRLAYLCGFALMAFGSRLLQQNIILVIGFLALAIISFLLYPAFYHWLIRRRVTNTYRDPKNSATLAARTLRVNGDGLEEKSLFGEVKVKWEVIDELALTPTHAFISIQSVPSIIVPKDRISMDHFQSFVNVCRENIEKGAA